MSSLQTLGLALVVSILAAAGLRAEPDHGVILVYHHVSTDTPASTSVTPAQFDAHLQALEEGEYRVWPLPRLLSAIFDQTESVPEDVVVITFDDAYESVFTTARPRLNERGWPYSVFVNTGSIDAGHSPYMSWDQLRTLAGEGVTIGNHSEAHGPMSRPQAGESSEAWRQRVRADIAGAHRRLVDELGQAPEIFAYPYGEDSPELAEIVAERYRFALAQRSGPIGPLTNPLSMPRFPMATGFASLDRLTLAIDTLPLPVRRVETAEPAPNGAIDWIRLTVDPGGFRAEQLACFSGSGEALPVSFEPGEVLVFQIDVSDVGQPGRNKINCTAPERAAMGKFYWYSNQWKIKF